MYLLTELLLCMPQACLFPGPTLLITTIPTHSEACLCKLQVSFPQEVLSI